MGACLAAGVCVGACGYTGSMYEEESMQGMTWGDTNNDPGNVDAPMFAMRVAAGETGRFAYDSAFPNAFDDEGFRREARRARSLGYIGKSCIHPRQIALANEIFASDELDLATARRIVEAAAVAAASGHGAFLLDGRMIDKPVLTRAQALIATSSK